MAPREETRTIHVLSIEDNPADALLIREKLHEAQRVSWDLPYFEVRHVDRLQAALDLLNGLEDDVATVDVVLTDLDLPDSRAGETVATLREHIPHLALVVLTGREDESLARTSVRAGVQDYLYKNEATGSLLARTMMYAIERQQIHRELEQRVAARTAELERSRQIAERERDTAERYLNIAPSIIIALDTEGRITLLNEMGADILECDRERAIGQNWFETFLPAREQDDVRAIFGQLMTGDVQPVEYVESTVLTGQGDERVIHWYNTLLRRQDGEIAGLLSSGEDITERKQAEDAYREESYFARQLMDAIPIPVFYKDRRGRYQGCNTAFEMFMGMRETDLVGKTAYDIAPPDRARLYAETDRALYEHGGIQIYEATIDAAGGEPRQVIINKATYQDTRGGVRGLVGGILDVTEQKQALADLERSEATYRQLIEALQEGIWALDTEGTTTFVNPRMAEMLGYSEAEMLGKHLFAFMDEAGIEKAKYYLARRRQGEAEQHEFAFVRKDGSRILTLMSTSPLLDGAGQYDGALAGVVDITARKRAEQALKRNEARFRGIFEQAAAGIAMVLPNGQIIEANEKLGEILGYSKEELTARTVRDLTPPEDFDAEQRYTKAVLAGQRDSFQLEKRYIHKQGHIIWANVSSNVIRDENRDIRFVIGVVVDITEHKRAEAKLERYATELERSNRELEHVGYVISHDLREPLRMVKSYLDLLQKRCKDTLDAKARAFIDQAAGGAERMQAMIQALLDLSRIETQGRGFAPTDTEALLDHTLTVLHPMIEEAGAEITHDPLPTVMADPAQLAQVFQNLIANALKFRREGVPPRVHIAAREGERGGEWVFTIADNGIGVPPDQTDRLFQIFQRLHTEDEYEGLGIGLALCKRIVARHGGRIWVESEPGAGATFTFTLSA